ncbi:hypothetical protein HHI36_021601 [Cryptolaemus montrouzieri]|uniref:COMM domain-containing protein 3 n=1 Tax=Cryptolaemus montrouzieri TaxID=559131 RepID=A0ABD2MXM7_9CUCU
MYLKETTKKSLQLANNLNVVNDTTYKNLLENCFSVLVGGDEIHADGTLLGSKPDLIKELYANLLISTAEFVRNALNKEDVLQYLTEECKINQKRAEIYSSAYSTNKQGVEISLLNIGNHPPHITDVSWKIDFVVKSNHLDHSGGPLFRIAFTTEKFDQENLCKKIQHVNFTCDSQEMQDLVYKLKDAVRHCERLAFDN